METDIRNRVLNNILPKEKNLNLDKDSLNYLMICPYCGASIPDLVYQKHLDNCYKGPRKN